MILGCGQPHGPQGHNIARVAALRAGLPVTDRRRDRQSHAAISGLQAIVQAAHMIVLEGADGRSAAASSRSTMVQRDASPNPGVQERYPGVYMVMGETAEVVAKRVRHQP